MAHQMSPGLPPQYPQSRPGASWNQTPAHSPPLPGSMGPPQRPADRSERGGGARAPKATDINDLSDAVTAAGIDVADEENYLQEAYLNRQQTSTSFNASFNSQSSSTISPQNSFGVWSQGGSGAFAGSGPSSQAAKTPEEIEQELKARQQRAANVLNEYRSHHLNDPFLQANNVRHKIQRRAYENGIQANVEGLFDKLPETPQGPQGVNGKVYASGPDGTGIAVVKAHSLLTPEAPLVDVLTLLSYAANERLRGLLEESYRLCKNRQISSHGIVPADFASIAVGDEMAKETTVTPQPVSGTAWDRPGSAGSSQANPLKRPHPSSTSLPTPPSDGPPTPQKSIFFPSPLINTLRSIASRDRKLEEARVAKRAKRRKTAAASEETTTSASAADASAAADAAAAASTKISKKEQIRLQKSNQTEEALHRNANATASFILGGGGKKYSWMTGGGGGGAAKSGTSAPKANAVTAKATTSVPSKDSVQGRDRRFGDFREDAAKGRNIQLRDLLAVLEVDGKEKKTLVRAYTRLEKGEPN